MCTKAAILIGFDDCLRFPSVIYPHINLYKETLWGLLQLTSFLDGQRSARVSLLLRIVHGQEQNTIQSLRSGVLLCLSTISSRSSGL